MKRYKLQYAPAPVANPLRGLVPYVGDVRDKFPHTMEFSYLPLSALVTAHDTYNWKPLENLLNEIAGRGHQAVFRIYLEYPGIAGGIPDFLIKEGLKVHSYKNTDVVPSAAVQTPDYENPRLRQLLQRFIAILGKKYDGDPRIAFLTAGLLGMWGEWHDHPRSELFASKTVQTEVMDAYEAAFSTTPVLLRYPADGGPHLAANHRRRFGYHDDSFAWATLDTSRKEDFWYYLPALKASGPAAIAKWKTQPIGGEIRPEAWGKVFDADPGDPRIQNFDRCVAETHASWLMDSGMFKNKASTIRLVRAERAVRRMGYEFHVRTATLDSVGGTLSVTLEIENRGVAPFYYDWPAHFGLIAGGKLVKTFPGRGKLIRLLPGQTRTWREKLPIASLDANIYKLVLHVPNTLKNGLPIRFANKSQDADLPGWLTLGECPPFGTSWPG